MLSSQEVLAGIPSRSGSEDPADICVIVSNAHGTPRSPMFVSRGTLVSLFTYAEVHALTVVVVGQEIDGHGPRSEKVIGPMGPVAPNHARNGYYGDGYAGAVYIGGMLRRGESRPHTGT